MDVMIVYLLRVQKHPNNEPEIGRVFVSSLERHSSFRFDTRRHISYRRTCDIKNVVPLPRVITKKDDLYRITPNERRRKVSKTTSVTL